MERAIECFWDVESGWVCWTCGRGSAILFEIPQAVGQSADELKGR